MACLGKRLEASSSPALTQGLAPIAQRLGDMHAAHTFCAVEIGKRPGHALRASSSAIHCIRLWMLSSLASRRSDRVDIGVSMLSGKHTRDVRAARARVNLSEFQTETVPTTRWGPIKAKRSLPLKARRYLTQPQLRMSPFLTSAPIRASTRLSIPEQEWTTPNNSTSSCTRFQMPKGASLPATDRAVAPVATEDYVLESH